MKLSELLGQKGTGISAQARRGGGDAGGGAAPAEGKPRVVTTALGATL